MNSRILTVALMLGFGALATVLPVEPNVGIAHAQAVSESHMKAARDAVAATRASDRFDDILPTIAEQAKSQLIGTRPDQEAQISEIVDSAAIELAPRRGDLEREVALVYARAFSEEELNRIAEFFSTETGAKFLGQTPALLRELEEASRIWGAGIGRDLSQKVGEKLKEAGLQ